MKHWLFCLFIALLLWLLPATAQAAVVTPEIFRLQVVAQSDSEKDQAIKLQVRDAVLALAQQMFTGANSAQNAQQLARENILLFQRAAQQAASGMCNVRVEVGEFNFPDRIYGGVRVPAGEYAALRVTLGAGEGHNWWCVLYPSLCCIDETAVQDDGTITFYSSTLEFLRRLFGGDE